VECHQGARSTATQEFVYLVLGGRTISTWAPLNSPRILGGSSLDESTSGFWEAPRGPHIGAEDE